MDALIYLRCSTQDQTNSLDIQRRMATAFCQAHGYSVIDIIEEVASGKSQDRAGYISAVSRCRDNGYVLVATKIDRLARRVSTIGSLIDSGVSLRVVALGNQPVSKLVLAVFSAMAECERDFISQRTREALAHLKSQGVKLGNPNLKAARVSASASRTRGASEYKASMTPIIQDIQDAGATTLRDIASALNRLGYTARRGGKFHPSTVRTLIA